MQHYCPLQHKRHKVIEVGIKIHKFVDTKSHFVYLSQIFHIYGDWDEIHSTHDNPTYIPIDNCQFWLKFNGCQGV